MKKLFYLKLFFIGLCMMANTGCDNDDDGGNIEDSLPPTTQVGANTIGCLVNGEVFLPKQEGINPAVVVNYEFIDGEFYFGLTFRDQRGSGVKSVNVTTQRLNLEAGGTYMLDKNYDDDGDYIGGGGTYGINAQIYYQTNIQISGELVISRVDLSNSIISGTFWFDAINEEGEVVEIREGRFDYVY